MTNLRDGRRAWLGVAMACAASCGGGRGAEAPPAYVPVNSPEAQTPCPGERERAQSAREALLGAGGAGVRVAAATAVLAQAECERGHFDDLVIVTSAQVAMLDAVRQAREQYQNARNLYDEVVGYGEPELLGAGARLGDLHAAFAAKLRRLGPPADVRDPRERADYRAELDELAATLEQEAALAYARALEAAAAMDGIGGFHATEAAWVRDACEALAALSPQIASTQPLCAR